MPVTCTEYITNFKFQGNGLCSYLEYVGKKKIRPDRVKIKMPSNNGKSSGMMTKGAIKRCRNYLDLWTNAVFTVQQIKHNPSSSYRRFITFITLTLPSEQQDGDREIKRYILYPFLESLQRYYNVKNYIWKAERQKNGNVHFHLIVDKYIRHELIRHHWNYHLDKKGYIRRYTEKRMIDHKKELEFLSKLPNNALINCSQHLVTALFNSMDKNEKFPQGDKEHAKYFSSYLKRIKKHVTFGQVKARVLSDLRSGFTSPNSTDIHAPQKIKNLTAYVVKIFSKEPLARDLKKGSKLVAEMVKDNSHISKETDKIRIDGRCWGRSDDLSKLTNFYTVEDTETIDFCKRIKELGLARIIDGDFFEFLSFNLYEVLSKHSKTLYAKIKEHFTELYYLLYPDNQLKLALIT